MTSKVKLSVDVSAGLRDELKIYANLHKVPIQAVVIEQVLELLRTEAVDGETRYSYIADREVLGLPAETSDEVEPSMGEVSINE